MCWKKELKKGKQFLAEEDLAKALKCFETAVSNCPVSASAGLEKSLFFLGTTLEKLGRHESALKCWHMGAQLAEEGSSRDMIAENSNSYGMYARDYSEREEDRKAFVGLQLERYFHTKKVKRFCSDAEKDVIIDIILSYWSDMLLEGKIYQLSIDEKVRFFREQPVVFPVADIESLKEYTSGNIVYMDFQKKRTPSMNDLCTCGSGLLFGQCCGRIKFPVECESGEF